jgi:transposase
MSLSEEDQKKLERLQVVKARLSGMSYADIAEAYHKDQHYVDRWVSQYQNTATVEDKGRSGRPSKLTPRILTTIKRGLKRPYGSLRRVQRHLEDTKVVTVGKSTIGRAVPKLAIRKVKARKKPLLTDVSKKKRLKFATSQPKTEKSWQNVLFVDEKVFKVEFGPKSSWVGVNDPARILPTMKHPSSIMVGGGFSSTGRTRLVKIDEDKNLDALGYVQILKKSLIPDLKKIFPAEIDWKLLEDNAPVHRAKITKMWYQKQHLILISEFPPYSPDLNPIENLWKILADRVSYRNPKTKSQLWDVLQQEWKKMPKEILQKLAGSMPTRLKAVIAAKGGLTKY